MADFVLLIPASEGKKEGGNPYAPRMFDYRASTTFNYFSELNPQRRELIQALHEVLDGEEEALQQLFGVKGAFLEAAIRANREVMESPLMAALDRYAPGVLYQAMDFASLPTGAQRRLLEHTIIFSGLLGLLRPDDLIPNYRLRMDAVLPGLGKVSRFWRPHISPILNDRLKDRFVWNLLPAAHREAWEDGHTYRGMVEVRFFKERNGQRKAISHGVKQLRGALVNYIVRHEAASVEDILPWRPGPEYRWDEDAFTWDEETRSGTLVMIAHA